MNKVCLIYQPCGLGDILFLQKVAWHYHSQGYKIVWPVVCEFSWLSEVMPWFNFVSWGDNEHKISGPPLPDEVIFDYKEYYHPQNPHVFTEDFVFLNFFNISLQPLIMKNKYDFVGIDFHDYAQYIKYEENKQKQDELYKMLVGDKTKYSLVNENFCTRPFAQKKSIPNPNPNEENVYMEIIPGYNLFDWIKIIENAEKICIVETSINYLLENLWREKRLSNVQSFSLYHRNNNFEQVDYLFKIPWEYKYA